IGIKYHGTECELKGQICNAIHIEIRLLTPLLTDDSEYSGNLPTEKDILSACNWLIRSACANNLLFFHYSGHRGQTPGDGVNLVVLSC
ncbi:hypothetical protein DL96DRAFT_1538577, partial [Flagelloscypha sp. PMI_526]